MAEGGGKALIGLLLAAGAGVGVYWYLTKDKVCTDFTDTYQCQIQSIFGKNCCWKNESCNICSDESNCEDYETPGDCIANGCNWCLNPNRCQTIPCGDVSACDLLAPGSNVADQFPTGWHKCSQDTLCSWDDESDTWFSIQESSSICINNIRQKKCYKMQASNIMNCGYYAAVGTDECISATGVPCNCSVTPCRPTEYCAADYQCIWKASIGGYPFAFQRTNKIAFPNCTGWTCDTGSTDDAFWYYYDFDNCPGGPTACCPCPISFQGYHEAGNGNDMLLFDFANSPGNWQGVPVAINHIVMDVNWIDAMPGSYTCNVWLVYHGHSRRIYSNNGFSFGTSGTDHINVSFNYPETPKELQYIVVQVTQGVWPTGMKVGSITNGVISYT